MARISKMLGATDTVEGLLQKLASEYHSLQEENRILREALSAAACVNTFDDEDTTTPSLALAPSPKDFSNCSEHEVASEQPCHEFEGHFTIDIDEKEDTHSAQGFTAEQNSESCWLTSFAAPWYALPIHPTPTSANDFGLPRANGDVAAATITRPCNTIGNEADVISATRAMPALGLWPVWAEETPSSARPRDFTYSWQIKSYTTSSRCARAGDVMRSTEALQRFVLRPSAVRRLIWDMISLLLLGYDIVFLPLIAFDLPWSGHMVGMDIFACSFWTFDIGASFFVGFHSKGVVEMRPSRVARQYSRSWFVPDVALVALDWCVIVAADSPLRQIGMLRVGKTVRFFRILRMFRMLRILKAVLLFDELCEAIYSKSLLTVLGIGKSVVGIMIVNHMIACAWYALGNNNFENGECSWVKAFEGQAEEETISIGYRYLSSLHWSLSQFTPASMEIVPCNSYERFFTIVVIISALIIFSSFLGSITSAMTKLRITNIEIARQHDLIRRYLSDNRASLELGNRIFCFMRYQGNLQRKRRVHEADISALQNLPEALHLDLRSEVFLPVLAPHPLFHHYHQADESGLVNVCYSAMGEQSLLPGKTQFALGDSAAAMFFVQSGDLHYHHGVSEELSTQVEAGCSVCEMALWCPWEHRGRLVASSPCEFATIDAVAFRSGVSVTVSYPWVARYARLYMERLRTSFGSCGEELSDIWYNFDAAQEMAQIAFESCNSSRPRLETARRFEARPSLTMTHIDSTLSDRLVDRMADWLKSATPSIFRRS